MTLLDDHIFVYAYYCIYIEYNILHVVEDILILQPNTQT